MLENQITAMIKALNANTTALQGKGALPPKDKVAGKTTKKVPSTEITYEQVREQNLAFSKKHGRDALIEVFGEFGVEKATELTEDQFSEYLDKLKETNEALDDIS